MYDDYKTKQEELDEEARGIMQDSMGELHVSPIIEPTCYGPEDKHNFAEGSDAWEALNAMSNIELSPQDMITNIWDIEGNYYTVFGDKLPNDPLGEERAWGNGYDEDQDCNSAWGFPPK